MPNPAASLPQGQGSLADRALAYLAAHRTQGGAGRFALQLMVACLPESVEALIKVTGASVDLWYVPYQHQGRACYKVFWGDYASLLEAESARNALPDMIVRQFPKTPIVRVEKALR